MTELNPSTVEIVSSESDATRCSNALFDFDGTISLIRSGWTDVMVPMMVEILADLGGDESEGELTTVVEDQMIELARQISLRGGKPLEPMMYKHMYLNRLDAHIKLRVEGLSAGTISPDELMVPGSRSLMQTLQKRGLSLYLACGTDESYLSREAELLQVDTYFDGHIYGAREDYKNFSKKILINRILCEGNFKGENFLAFGACISNVDPY